MSNEPQKQEVIRLLTAEYCSPLHPDKICDRIADAIVDAYLEKDSEARCAIEVMGGHGKIDITGEILSDLFLSPPDIDPLIRGIIKDPLHKITKINVNITRQSEFITKGVDEGGAGDQGIAVGYACFENKEMIPHELYLAKSLCKFIYEKFPEDGKTQITIDNKAHVHSVVISWCNVGKKELKQLFWEWQVKYRVGIFTGGDEKTPKFKLHTNPSGDWTVGGFDADTGLTGRKIVMDNYGPRVPIGGGSFSGKDATKVDRSGAYAARRIALDIIEEYDGKVKQALVKLAYAIGCSQPIMATVETNGGPPQNLKFNDTELTPSGIIDNLELKKPQFYKLATWGHFGSETKWDRSKELFYKIQKIADEKSEKEKDQISGVNKVPSEKSFKHKDITDGQMSEEEAQKFHYGKDGKKEE